MGGFADVWGCAAMRERSEEVVRDRSNGARRCSAVPWTWGGRPWWVEGFVAVSGRVDQAKCGKARSLASPAMKASAWV